MHDDSILPPDRILRANTEPELRDQFLFEELANYINELIRNDFEQLVRILYRMDVSEPKLKQLLRNHPDEDAGKLIASMMIDRQLEKIRTRQQFKDVDGDTGEEERW